MNKALKIGINHWTLEVKILNFGLVLVIMMMIWGLPKDGSFGKRIFVLRHTILK
jgi:hypothetical protein